MQKCPNCGINRALHHPIYGILVCSKCQQRRKYNPLPANQVEITTDSIKQQRKEYQKSIIQPRRDGVLSKEYLSINGTKGIKATPQEIKEAEYVWSDSIDEENLDRTK